MKHSMVVTLLTCGLACVASVAAQDQTTVTTMQDVTVTGAPYETYLINLHRDFGLKALVGHTHRNYMQAQKAARQWEVLRMQGLAPRPYVAVAIDDSIGPGTAQQIQLADADRHTLAIVNVYCRRSVQEGANRCQFVQQSKTHDYAPRLSAGLADVSVDMGW